MQVKLSADLCQSVCIIMDVCGYERGKLGKEFMSMCERERERDYAYMCVCVLVYMCALAFMGIEMN